MSTIHCQQVKKSFVNHVVLENINLTLNEGEMIALVGLNGSGKSTLIKAILNLIDIDGGEITIQQHAHTQIKARKNISYLPDRFSPPAHLTANNFIDYMQRLDGAKKTTKEIELILKKLALDKTVLTQSVKKLSKGMTQKLGLASCLLSEKQILILDEPMSGLDIKASVALKQQLLQLKQQGKSILFSSHHLRDVAELADRIVVLYHGVISFDGTVEHFRTQFKTENLEQAFLNCTKNRVDKF